jgi:hypothetical protein
MPNSLTVLEALDLVPDPRSRHDRIHPLVAVLGLTTTGSRSALRRPVRSRRRARSESCGSSRFLE